jgi:hypothetical protein
MPSAPLTPLEDATVRYVLAHAGEGDGWLDLTRICSQTGRMLPEVRDTILRLGRRGVLKLDDQAPHTNRWMRFLLPKAPTAATPARELT